MMRKSVFFILFSLIFAACAFGTRSQKDEDFERILSLKDLNSDIVIWAPEESNSFKSGDAVFLAIENRSKERILFPFNYGVRLFVYNQDHWNEIENNVNFLTQGDRQLSPKGKDSPGIITLTVNPKKINSQEPVELRIVVLGNKENLSEAGNVGAFLDITLMP